MEEIRKYFHEHDHFARQAGVVLDEVRPGFARARMDIRKEVTNGVGIAHGGAIFTLADIAFGAAANTHGRVALAINASISFCKPGKAGVLVAEAREISLGPTLATYQVIVRDDAEDVVATFQGTVFRKTSPFPPERISPRK